MMKTRKLYIKYSVIFYFLFFFSVTILSIFFSQITPHETLYDYKSTVFNLVYYLPSSIWVAASALGGLFLFLFLCRIKEITLNLTNILMFMSMLTIFLVIYGLPYMIEQNPRFVDSWVHGRTAKTIIDNGYLRPDEFGYHAYPSSFLIFSCFSLISGIEATLLLRVLPPIFVFSFFSLFTYLANILLNNPKIAIASTFVFGLSAYNLFLHFSPAIFGWLLMFL